MPEKSTIRQKESIFSALFQKIAVDSKQNLRYYSIPIEIVIYKFRFQK